MLPTPSYHPSVVRVRACMRERVRVRVCTRACARACVDAQDFDSREDLGACTRSTLGIKRAGVAVHVLRTLDGAKIHEKKNKLRRKVMSASEWGQHSRSSCAMPICRRRHGTLQQRTPPSAVPVWQQEPSHRMCAKSTRSPANPPCHVRTRAHALTHARTHTHTRICAHSTHTHAQTHACTRAHVGACVRMRACRRARACVLCACCVRESTCTFVCACLRAGVWVGVRVCRRGCRRGGRLRVEDCLLCRQWRRGRGHRRARHLELACQQ